MSKKRRANRTKDFNLSSIMKSYLNAVSRLLLFLSPCKNASFDNKTYIQEEKIALSLRGALRTPNPLNEATKTADTQELPSLESSMPELYTQLDNIRTNLEKIKLYNHLLVHSSIPGLSQLLGFEIQRDKSYLFRKEVNNWHMVRVWNKPENYKN